MDQDQQSRLKELIAKGKEQGFLTYTEVNDHLPEGIVEPEQIEDEFARRAGRRISDGGFDEGRPHRRVVIDQHPAHSVDVARQRAESFWLGRIQDRDGARTRERVGRGGVVGHEHRHVDDDES